MVEKRFCDICGNEFKKFDRIFHINYGEVGILKRNNKKGQICNNCLNDIDNFIESIKRKNR